MIARIGFGLRILAAIVRRLVELSAHDRRQAERELVLAEIEVLSMRARPVIVGARFDYQEAAGPPSLDSAPGWSELPAWLWAPAVAPDYVTHSWPAADASDPVIHWLRFTYPDAWWEASIPTLLDVAEGLLGARAQAAKTRGGAR